MREYIVSIKDNESNTAEVFVGQIRQQEEVIRCGECCHFKNCTLTEDYVCKQKAV